jgi:hypothetical protein
MEQRAKTLINRSQWLKMSSEQLDELFKQSAPGNIANHGELLRSRQESASDEMERSRARIIK